MFKGEWVELRVSSVQKESDTWCVLVVYVGQFSEGAG